MPIVIRELDPKTGKPKPKAKKKKNPPQVAKGGGMMKKKGMRRGGAMKSKGMSKGGKLRMVEKDGKKVPFFAADGKGKMAAGGRMKKKGMKKGGMMKKGYAKGGRTVNDPDIANRIARTATRLSNLEKVNVNRRLDDKAANKAPASKNKPSGMALPKKRPSSVKVKSGDTLSQIAKSKGLTLSALMAANPGIKNANEIRVGQSIKMPTGGAKKRAQETAKKKGVYGGTSKPVMSALDRDTVAKRKNRNKKKNPPMVLKKGGAIKKKGMKKGGAMKKKGMKKGGMMKKKGMAMGGAMRRMKSKGMAKGGMMRKKGMSKGGVMRGTGAATRGKRFTRAG